MKADRKYQKEICECCGQTKTYTTAMSKAGANIVKAFQVAIGKKGINVIHPGKEMVVAAREWSINRMLQDGSITPQMWKNLTQIKQHGLIARVKGEVGNYLLTTKGAKFLRGERIAKYAIISKVDKRNIGYWLPDEETVCFKEFIDDDPNWELMDYDIVEGRVVKTLPIKEVGQSTLL